MEVPEAFNCVTFVFRLVLYSSAEALCVAIAVRSGAGQAQRSERVQTYFGTAETAIVIVTALT